MDTHVGLNVTTRVCDVYPDKCWFVVLCRFWVQCSRTLRLPSSVCTTYCCRQKLAFRMCILPFSLYLFIRLLKMEAACSAETPECRFKILTNDVKTETIVPAFDPAL